MTSYVLALFVFQAFIGQNSINLLHQLTHSLTTQWYNIPPDMLAEHIKKLLNPKLKLRNLHVFTCNISHLCPTFIT